MTAYSAASPRATIEAIWHIESPKLIARLARMVRGDVGLAEELAQEAFVAALSQWPRDGMPDNAGAWLMTAAKRGAIDLIRRDKVFRSTHEELARELEQRQEELDAAKSQSKVDGTIDGEVEDDLLRLLFVACHPELSSEARSAITLRLLCGLTTGEIARAFLTSEATIAQRIVRAKKTFAEKQIPFEVPSGAELPERLDSVLQVIYLLFNEGYAATTGEDWMRPALCDEALRLGRIVATLLPKEPEVHGLVALLEIQASRMDARVDASGKPILLLEQDRLRWNQTLIRRGLAARDIALKLSSTPGQYTLQASIAACHARARRPDETDWKEIAGLYGELGHLSQSPIVELNRAVAMGMAFGPEEGLQLVNRLAAEPTLSVYHLLPAVRGDFLEKLGRFAEAQAEFERAAMLAQNVREREVLRNRAAKLAKASRGQGPK